MPLPQTAPNPRTDAEPIGSVRRPRCVVCRNDMLNQVVDLPQLPLTGIIIPPGDRARYPAFDQAVLFCAHCGHVQLREAVSPAYLYQKTYSNRTSKNVISTRVNDFFYNFVMQAAERTTFRSILEIGCNDLYLLRRLKQHAECATGLDPIWKDSVAPAEPDLKVIGKYIEEFCPAEDVCVRPDLVIAVHTLEHICNPFEALRDVYHHAADGATFVIEVPCWDTIMSAGRFDQIYHQHLNYFSLRSMLNLIAALKARYLQHTYNYSLGLGSLIVAFRKDSSGGQDPSAPTWSANLITSHYDEFRRRSAVVRDKLAELKALGTNLVGFGAAQLLPTLAYHMGSDFAELDAILDDDEGKTGLSYPNVQSCIKEARSYGRLKQSAVLVTAVDSTRAIVQRAHELGARYIISPAFVI